MISLMSPALSCLKITPGNHYKISQTPHKPMGEILSWLLRI